MNNTSSKSRAPKLLLLLLLHLQLLLASLSLVSAEAATSVTTVATTIPFIRHRIERGPHQQNRAAFSNPTPASWATISIRGGAAQKRTLNNQKTKTTPSSATNDKDKDNGASIATSVFNLANNVAGAGILTLAAGKATGTGWIPSIAICLTLAAVSSHTFSLVGKSCDLTGLNSFKDLWAYAFRSDKSAWIVDTMVFVQCFFVSIIYTGLLGDIFSALLRGTLGIERWWTNRTPIICIAASTILFPLNLIRDLTSLGFTSILGLIAILYTVGFMVVRALDGSYEVATATAATATSGYFVTEGLLPAIPSFAKSSLWNVDMNSLVLMSNLGLAFISHYNAPSYWKSLGKSATAQKFSIISRRAYLVLAIIYVTTMVAGYATFGDASMGNILLNYSSSDVLATLGRLATGLSIVFGFPLVSNGCREGFKNAASALGLFRGARDPHNHTQLVATLLLITTSLSIVAKDVGLVAGFTGALMGSALVYICPPLLYSKIVERKLGADSKEYQLVKRNLLWIPFGLFTASMGVTMTLKNALGSK